MEGTASANEIFSFAEAISKLFGLTPEQYSENLRDNYQRYEVVQHPEEPIKEAENHLSKWAFLEQMKYNLLVLWD